MPINHFATGNGFYHSFFIPDGCYQSLIKKWRICNDGKNKGYLSNLPQ